MKRLIFATLLSLAANCMAAGNEDAVNRANAYYDGDAIRTQKSAKSAVSASGDNFSKSAKTVLNSVRAAAKTAKEQLPAPQSPDIAGIAARAEESVNAFIPPTVDSSLSGNTESGMPSFFDVTFGRLLSLISRDKFGPGTQELPQYSTEDAINKALPLLADYSTGKISLVPAEGYPMKFTPAGNNKIEWILEAKAFDRQLEDYSRARKFLLVHNFVLSDHRTAKVMTDAALAVKSRGADVFVTFDTFGTNVYGRTAFRTVTTLMKAGVKVGIIPFSSPQAGLAFLEHPGKLPFQGHLSQIRMHHTKLAILDSPEGPIYYTGGQGWADELSGWNGKPAFHDGMFRITGEAALQQLVVELWQLSQRGVQITPPGLTKEEAERYIRKTFFDYPNVSGDVAGKITVLNNLTWKNRQITDEFYKQIDDPEVKEIYVAVSYITDSVVFKKFAAALRRGVRMKFLIPGESDALPVQIVMQDLCRKLGMMSEKLANGSSVETRRWRTAAGPTMSHQKYMIFVKERGADGLASRGAVLGGSYNLTAVEARVGEENNDILAEDPAFVNHMIKTFDGEFAQSDPQNPRGGIRGAAESVLSAIFMAVLGPIM